ncbi:MAG: protein-L-isoaspartate(D-aspartate) O-methyltransferase [Armatimonadetes bacterium]|nr:protein-L-isoaspartate(D-aspartate) O-methyltransferase [Armatimonadota bacterium]
MHDFTPERKQMVETQLRRRGIKDERVLAAMERVPRQRFLLDPSDSGAHGDHPLSIGSGQTISQPYMVALMTEHLRLKGGEHVLEIGTGSGYQAAILAELSRDVVTVERFPDLAERASTVLIDLGYPNVQVFVGDGSLGWPDAAPYDRIIVTAAAPEVAPPWVDQLADGGRLVVPLGDRWGQTLTVLAKRGDELDHEKICGCVFVPLIGEHGYRGE